MLLRTPASKPTESLLGYALRVSETNGYETPWHILSYAGFDQSEMRTAGFPVEKLADILGRDASALVPIAYCADDAEGRYFKILDHRLGGNMQQAWLRLTEPQFCPRCAEEDGYLDAFWDLTQAVACPKHGCQLLTVCPNCGDHLRWFRPELLKCHCGADLRNAILEPAGAAVVQAMAILLAKLHGKSVLDLPNDIKFPLTELEPMPFKAYLVMLDRLARYNTLDETELRRRRYSAIEGAAQALADWPSGYHIFLKRLGTALERDRPSAIGLRKQFAPFYEAMFKRNAFTTDFDFLRTEFVNFGQELWGKALVDPKLLRDDATRDSRFQSRNETARDIGISPITLRNWAEKGLVPVTEVTAGSEKRYICDTATLPVVPVRPGKTFATREAAAQVSLPVSVLIGLRETGHYVSKSMPSQKPGFHELDLLELRSRILGRARLLNEVPSKESVVSLEYVLQEFRFWSENGKANFVAAYLDGDVEPIGRTGESWHELLFRRCDVETMARASRSKRSDGAISKSEAASCLGCGAEVVDELLSLGFLAGVPGPARTRVTKSSADRFAGDYVSLAALARQGNTSARHLDRICDRLGIRTLDVSRKGGSITKFIRIAEHQQLLASHRDGHKRERN